MSKNGEYSAPEPDWSDDEGILKQVEGLIDKSPLQALSMLRGFHLNSMKGHHRRTKATIVHAYACACKLKKSKRLTTKFYGQDFFRRRKHTLKEAKLLRMTMCYIVGSLEGSDYGQALSYERAVRPFFKREADPSELREALSNKTIDQLEKKAKADKDAERAIERGKPDGAPHGEQGETSTDSSGSEEQSEDDIEEQESDASLSESEASSPKAVAKSAPGPKRTLKLIDLRLESADDYSLRILENPKYVRGVIEYKRIGTESGYKRVIVTDVRKM